MSLRVNLCGKVKGETPEAVAKASLNRAIQYHIVDPKPRDLSMARLKLWETSVEDRTLVS